MSFYYGVDSGDLMINPGQTAVITVTPSEQHIPKRLHLHEEVGESFSIQQVRAGVEPLLARPVDARVFCGEDVPSFRPKTMNAGDDLSVEVKNTGRRRMRFTCTVEADRGSR